MQLRIPGPTPCPQQVLQAMGQQMIDHRGVQFAKLMQKVTEQLKQVFQTKGDVFVLTASGTGGMESAIVNTLSPGDKVLAVSCGYFGDRFADVAKAYGAQVKVLPFEWGKCVDPEQVRKALKADPGVKAVLVTHNESSTGVINDLKTIASVVRESDSLLLVDAVSSLAAADIQPDAWGCDIVATASQKALMTSPGMAVVSVGDRAWQAHKTAKMPRQYFDYTLAKSFLQKGQTPWTPSVATFFGLSAALDLILAEGLQNVFARHARMAKLVRQGAKSLGLSPLTEERCASPTVTSISAPASVNVGTMLQILREKYNVILAGGQGALQGKIFRIGHLGWITEKDVKDVMDSLAQAIKQAKQ